MGGWNEKWHWKEHIKICGENQEFHQKRVLVPTELWEEEYIWDIGWNGRILNERQNQIANTITHLHCWIWFLF